MKHLLLSGAVVVTVAGVCLVAAGDKLERAAQNSVLLAQKDAGKKAAPKKDAPQPAKTAPAGKVPASQPAPAPKGSPEDEAVSKTGAALVRAFVEHDAKAFAAVFTSGGEYVDEKGIVYHGRQAIEDDFTAFFKANPESAIELTLSSTRWLAAGAGQTSTKAAGAAAAPGIGVADGTTRFTRAKGEPPVAGRCTLVFAKEGGQWLVASLREFEAVDQPVSHHNQVRQLEFLVGDWLNQGGDSDVHFTCRWDEGLNFLIRDFAVHIAGEKSMTGTQRIGYDPLTGHLRAWIFDSAGGYADGFFAHDGENWILQTTGVTADGRIASGTQIFAPVDKHRLSWQAVDYVIAGERIPDSPKVMIVRRPPAPSTTPK
jgi:uncharacterized protein (TIGR02246 family)